YFVPPDGQHGVIFEDDTFEDGVSLIWRSPNGERHIYQEDLSHPFLHRVKRIEDKHGNYLRFDYDEFGRLRSVTVNDVNALSDLSPNSQIRILVFAYDDQGRIVLIRDYTKHFDPQGRQWRYEYDDLGDLIAVTSPVNDRYPNGL